MSFRLIRLHRIVLAVTMAFGLTFSATASMATEFKPEAAEAWVKRSETLARIAGDGTTQLEGEAILANMRAGCEGLQGEQMKNEYGKVPRWALTSQIFACSAFDRWSGRGFVKTKVPCLDVQRGIDALSQMNATEEAPEVVTAANNLKTLLQALLKSATTSNTFQCRYR